MSKHQQYEEVREVQSAKKAKKQNAIARRQQRRWSTKNGAEILFGVVYPNKEA